MFSFFKRKEVPPADDVENDFEIIEEKGTDESKNDNPLYPSPYPEHFNPSVVPAYPPVNPALKKESSITNVLQDVPFRLSNEFNRVDYSMALLKAKEILMYINRSADKSYQYKYDFNVEKSVMNEVVVNGNSE